MNIYDSRKARKMARKGKVVFIIGNRYVSRRELINYVAERYCVRQDRINDFLYLDIADYSTAEKMVNSIYQKVYKNRSAYYIVGDSHRFEMFGAEFRYEV